MLPNPEKYYMYLKVHFKVYSIKSKGDFTISKFLQDIHINYINKKQ